MTNVIARLFMFSLVVSMFTAPVHAGLPGSLSIEGANLKLNGDGVRKKAFMSLYNGGLYLTAKSSDANAIIAADEAMAVRLDITSGMITSENMEEALIEGIENATGGDYSSIKDHVNAFMAVFQEPIEKGDVFDIAYIPGKGIVIHKNDAYKATVDGGMPFKKAIFGIWLGDVPADKNLKKGMLGK